MTATPRDFPRAAKAALNDAALQGALGHMKAGFQERRRQAMAALPDAEAMRDDARAIRDYALSHLDELLVRFESQVRANGGQVHWARDAAEARAIVTRILTERGARIVTKGKSMLGEEIELNAHLEANGITPIETDLGEYIVQLRGERPSHIIAPAFHLRRSDVEASFRKAHTALDADRALPDRAGLVAEARAIRASISSPPTWASPARTSWWRRPAPRSSSPTKAMAISRGCCRGRTSFSPASRRWWTRSPMRRFCCAC